MLRPSFLPVPSAKSADEKLMNPRVRDACLNGSEYHLEVLLLYHFAILKLMSEKLPRVAAAVVVDERGRVLVVEHAEQDATTSSPRLTYVLPGGNIESDETIQQAAIRKARDETGHELEPIEIIHTESHMAYVACKLVELGEQSAQSADVSNNLWVEARDLRYACTTPVHPTVYAYLGLDSL